MGGTEAGHDLDFCVATWKSHCGHKRGRDIKLMSRHRVASRRVATWCWCHDLDWPEWCRDTDLMSRHGSARPMEIGVTTPFFEVATWVVLVRQKGGRDIGLTSRPSLVVQDIAT